MENTNQTELAVVVEITALDTVVNESGLQLNEAEQIKQSYLPYFNQIAEIKELAKKINFDNPTDLDEKIARELRLKVVKIRTGSETVKDERKRIHSLKAGIEQAAWNLIKADCLLNEEVFNNVEKARAIAETKRKDELKASRLELLTPLTDQAHIYPLGELSEDAFNDLLNGLELAAKAKKEQEEKEAAERIENERKQTVFNERRIELAKFGKHSEGTVELTIDTTQAEYSQILIDCENNRATYEAEQSRIKAENERLQNETIAKELQLEKERAEAAESARIEKEKADKILAEQKEKAEAEARIASEKAAKEKAEQDAILAKERAERAKLEAENQARLDAENKAKVDAAQKEKDRIAAEKKAAKAPDKDKIKAFVTAISMTVPMPIDVSDESLEVAKNILLKFQAFKKWANEQIEAL